MADPKNVKIRVSNDQVSEHSAAKTPTEQITKTPTEHITQKTMKPVTITDSLGRIIVLQRPSVLKTMDIMDFLGEKSGNQGYLGVVFPFFFVTSISGIPQFLNSMLDLKALAEQLGHEGREAIMDALPVYFNIPVSGGSTSLADAANEKQEIKK